MWGLDITDPSADIAARAAAEFKKLPTDVEAIFVAAAAEVNASHAYTNRTGNLEESTKAELDASTESFTVRFGAGMPYASFVQDRGLLDIDGAWDEANNEAEYLIDGLELIIDGG